MCLPFCFAGETIKIVIEDYVQHLSGYYLKLKFDPELLFGVQFQYRNRIAVEFNQLYHWHPLMPDSFNILGQAYNYSSYIYNTSMITDYGVEALVESFTKQIAGKVKCNLHCVTAFIKLGGKVCNRNLTPPCRQKKKWLSKLTHITGLGSSPLMNARRLPRVQQHISEPER